MSRKRYVNPELIQAQQASQAYTQQQIQSTQNHAQQQQQTQPQQQLQSQNYGQIQQQQSIPITTNQNMYYSQQQQQQQQQQRPTTIITFPWGNTKLLNPQPTDGSPPLPQYFRTTVTHFPLTKYTADNCGLPLGIIINPSQVVNVPIIDYSQSSIPRCSKCRAYLSPYAQPQPDGRSWRCPFCFGITNFVTDYTSNPAERSTEFVCPVYDMITPPQFNTMPKAGPCFVVIVDLSYEAIQTGFTLQLLSSLKASLDSVNQNTYIGLITMSNHLAIYDFKRSTEFVVTDLTDIVLPSSPLCLLKDCKEELVKMIDSIVENINNGKGLSTGNYLSSALDVAEMAMNGVGGILIASCVGCPTTGLRGIKERPLDDETKLLHLPQGKNEAFYREIGFRFNRSAVSVHIFNLKSPNQKISDLAIVSIPCGLTCGNCHYYKDFDPMQLHNDLFVTLTSEYLWNSSMRLRCSSGIKVANIFSNCTIREGTAHYPVMSAHSAVTFEVALENDVKESHALFQTAVLWTNNQRQRLIRIFTFALPTTNEASKVKSSIDEAAVITLYLKRAASRTLLSGPKDAADFVKKSIISLRYRCESMYHLAHSMLVSRLLRPQQTFQVDDRIANVIRCRSISLTNTLLYLYPQMIAADVDEKPLPLDSSSFNHGKCFVVHSIDKVYIWISPNVTKEYLISAFGVTEIEAIPQQFPVIEDSFENKQIHNIIDNCYNLSGKYLPVEIIPPGSPREEIFSEILVDMIPANGANLAAFISEMTSSLH